MNRVVQPEWLDELPAGDPRALRSRRDIRRLNVWMGHPRIMAGALRSAVNGQTALRIVELGAGDGHFLLHVARRLGGRGQNVAAILVDRMDGFDPQTRGRFNAFGWHVNAATADAIDWLRRSHAMTVDIILSNLLLHQLPTGPLAELLRLVAHSARVFIALEPRRAWWPLFCSRLLWVAGCGSVTRHDGPISVQAGFADRELSALWPEHDTALRATDREPSRLAAAAVPEPLGISNSPQNPDAHCGRGPSALREGGPDGGEWELTERPVGLFSHLFIAQRKG